MSSLPVEPQGRHKVLEALMQNPQALAGMPHADLYMARFGASRADQNILSPYEHRAFAREATQENPLMALPIAAAIPAYQAYKAIMGARSEPSMSQVSQGYAGVLEGLKARFGF